MNSPRVPVTISDVPNKPRPGRRHRSVQLQDEHWFPGETITHQMGTNRSAIIEQLYLWWLRVPGAELPERPPPEVIERAVAEWRAKQEDQEA